MIRGMECLLPVERKEWHQQNKQQKWRQEMGLSFYETVNHHRKLFLDDLRDPLGPDWDVVRSVEEFKQYILQHGMPETISFDHDLGENKETGLQAARWLANSVVAGQIKLPDRFHIIIHSANPIGAENIMSVWQSLVKFLDIPKENYTLEYIPRI